MKWTLEKKHDKTQSVRLTLCWAGAVNIKQSVRGEEMQAGAELGGWRGGTLLVPSLSGGVTGGGGGLSLFGCASKYQQGPWGRGASPVLLMSWQVGPSLEPPPPPPAKERSDLPTTTTTDPSCWSRSPPPLQQCSVWSAQNLQCCCFRAEVQQLKDSHLPSLTLCQRSQRSRRSLEEGRTVEASPALLDFHTQTRRQSNVGRKKRAFVSVKHLQMTVSAIFQDELVVTVTYI